MHRVGGETNLLDGEGGDLDHAGYAGFNKSMLWYKIATAALKYNLDL